MPKQIHIVQLSYNIIFNDADDGRCYAGDGLKIVRTFQNSELATSFIKEWNLVIALAEKENTVFPRQANNKKLHQEFGFDLHNIDDGEKFQLKLETWDVTE